MRPKAGSQNTCKAFIKITSKGINDMVEKINTYPSIYYNNPWIRGDISKTWRKDYVIRPGPVEKFKSEECC